MMARASLTTGPLAGQTLNIAPEVWERGTLFIMGEADPPEEVRDFYEPGAPVHKADHPVHEYRRVTMAAGLPGTRGFRTWPEWHYVPPRKAGHHGHED
jgi:hypothetical protein